MIQRVAVIGGGASGLVAALTAAQAGARVCLWERNERLGRKLLVTGSGRCNLTNDAVSAERYACADPQWMASLLAQFGVGDVLRLLESVGVSTYKTDDGWYYPRSNAAQSVVSALEHALRQARVEVCLGVQVTGLERAGEGFRLRVVQDGQQREERFSRVIVAAGGAAYPTLGSRGELFAELTRLGLRTTPKRPALAPVLAELGALRGLQGLRLDVGARLEQDGRTLAQSRGNLIVTEWGFNGPAVMDVSHAVSAHEGQRLTLVLDLLAFNAEEFAALLTAQRTQPFPAALLLGAFFPPKLAPVYLRMAGLPEQAMLNQLKEAEIQRLVGCLRETRLGVRGVRGFEYCQVSAGGVAVSEVEPTTLEARRLPGLYLTGETLDVVGPCGGFNLQYAFSSGALAGRAAARG